MFFKNSLFEKMWQTKTLFSLALLFFIFGCGQAKESDSISAGDSSSYQRDEIVERNMAAVQVAAEHYSADHEPDKFPIKLDDVFLTYFPGGTENKVQASSGQPNPFTGKLEFPIVIAAGERQGDLPAIRTADDVRNMRAGGRFKIGQGVIVYYALDNAAGYAIVGGAHDCYALMDRLNDGKVLVFSNID